MTRRRFSAALSLLLLALLATAVAEASLFGLIAVMSWILGLGVGVEFGPTYFSVQPRSCCSAQVLLFNAASVASVLFTAMCGVGAAMSRFRSWRPPA